MIEKENVLKFMEYIEKLAKVYDFNLPFGSYDIYAFAKDLLVWLEKQGEPQGKSALEVIKEEKVDNELAKSLCVEPKFKVGDWITFYGVNPFKVLKIESKINGVLDYLLLDQNGHDFYFNKNYVDKNARLWTIQDVKDGNVLVHSSFMFDDFIFIYNNTSILQAYCYYSSERNRFIIEDRGHHCPWNMQEVTPATKEQHDLLFKKMKEAGYEWDADKKELKKLVEPKFKVGDKIINNLRICTILEITNDKYIFTDGSYLFISNQDNWDLVPGKEEKFNPKTLQPFDKILMRDHSTEEWDIGYFSYIKYDLAGFDLSDCEEEGEFLVYTAGGANYWYAVPYNEETKHLVGTTDDAPEYYKYWEK